MKLNKQIFKIVRKVVIAGTATLALWFIYGHYIMPLFVGDKQEVFAKIVFIWFIPGTTWLLIFKPGHLLQKLTIALILASVIVFGLVGLMNKLGAL